MALTQITTGGVDENINIDSDTLKVDGTNNRVGIGTAAPSAALHAKSGTTDVVADFESTDANAWVQIRDNTTTDTAVMVGAVGNDMRLRAGSNERVRIDSTGRVGIGTAAPSNNLDILSTASGATVNARVGSTATSGVNNANLIINNGGTGNATLRFDYESSANRASIGVPQSTQALFFTTASSERMRIDQSGRVLIGASTSPSAGSGQYAKIASIGNTLSASGDGRIMLGRGAAAASLNADQNIGSVLFTDNTGLTFAAFGADVDGATGSGDYPARLFFSTTADGASTPTERMRIDSSGVVKLTQSGNNPRYGSLEASGDAFKLKAFSGNSSHHATMQFFTGTNSPTERMRINSTGEVGVGVSAPARFVHVKNEGSSNVVHFRIQQESSNTPTDGGAFLELGGTRSDGTYGFYGGIKGARSNSAAHNKGYLGFFADNNDGQSMSERMRLNSQGALLVGTDFTTATVSTSVQFRVRNGLGGHIAEFNRTDNVDGNNRDLISFRRGSAGSVGSITASNSAVQYNTSSDYRLKENVALITDGITRVKQLKPSRFNFIVNPGVMVDGFVAHEAATVVPEAVSGAHNEVDSENNPVYQGIDQSKLVPLLTAALQEAITKIETLEAKVAALEAAA